MGKRKAEVFVYGTLKRGHGLHYALSEAQYLGDYIVQGEMYNLGAFPALVPTTDHTRFVHGELYLVDIDTLAHLDAVEGTPNLYRRKTVMPVPCELADNGRRVQYIGSLESPYAGQCEVYVFNRPTTNMPLIPATSSVDVEGRTVFISSWGSQHKPKRKAEVK